MEEAKQQEVGWVCPVCNTSVSPKSTTCPECDKKRQQEQTDVNHVRQLNG